MVTGLARITVSTPHRRLDIAVPDQAPVAELLPELLRHAGSAPEQSGSPDGGWALRRTDGAVLSPARGLAAQGVVDGAVLHLAPVRAEWALPSYDDLAEAVATGARGRGAQWSPAATGTVRLVLAALLLAGGVAAVGGQVRDLSPAVPAAIAGAALLYGSVATRRGQPRIGVLLGGAALAYALAAGAAWAPAGSPALGGAAALAIAALVGAAAATVAHKGTLRDGLDGRCVHVAGLVVGLLGIPAALAAEIWSPPVAAAVLACVLVCGVGLLPLVAMRWGGLPAPPLGGAPASPGLLSRDVAFAAVARADELLTAALVGWSLLGVAAIGVLVAGGDAAGRALAAIAATALVLRSRLFVAVRHRLPLLAGGLGGYAVLAVALVAAAPGGVVAVVVPSAAAAALLLAVNPRASRAAVCEPGSVASGGAGAAAHPWWGRVADAADTVAIVAVVPVAAAVLDLYTAALVLIAPA